GPALPRRNQSASIEKHAKLMLILFKPWRHASDLRHSNQTWSQAYQHFLRTCSEDITRCIDNMQLLHECKESQDAHYTNQWSQEWQKARGRAHERCDIEPKHRLQGIS
ncbi:hypothetical protein B0H19DRAFT_969172, partial [Mycena capillaripes]